MHIHRGTRCPWEDTECLSGHKVSDTTMRLRRGERIKAGAFDGLGEEGLHAYAKIVGLELSDLSVDGSLQRSLVGAREPERTRPTGPNSGRGGLSSPT
jgi:hypothetical protein